MTITPAAGLFGQAVAAYPHLRPALERVEPILATVARWRSRQCGLLDTTDTFDRWSVCGALVYLRQTNGVTAHPTQMMSISDPLGAPRPDWMTAVEASDAAESVLKATINQTLGQILDQRYREQLNMHIGVDVRQIVLGPLQRALSDDNRPHPIEARVLRSLREMLWCYVACSHVKHDTWTAEILPLINLFPQAVVLGIKRNANTSSVPPSWVCAVA